MSVTHFLFGASALNNWLSNVWCGRLCWIRNRCRRRELLWNFAVESHFTHLFRILPELRVTCPSGIGQKYLSCVAVGRVRLTLAQTIAFEQLDHRPDCPRVRRTLRRQLPTAGYLRMTTETDHQRHMAFVETPLFSISSRG